ncbi:MAG TPA: hypothetical protein VGF46_00930 [Gaiellales bacterium]
MRVLRPVLAVIALLLALGAVLLAIDVGRWQDRIVSNDRVLAADPLAPVHPVPSTLVPFDPARRLVGLADDLRLRSAIQAFVVARHTGAGFDNGDERARRVEIAESGLEDVILRGSPRQVSQAEVLLGVLEFGGKTAPTGVDSPAQAAVSSFTEAARLEPDNLPAKFDLELALRAITPVGVRPGSNPSAGIQGHGQNGAGSGLPGSGF